MQLSKNSLFYKFLTMFDTNKFIVGSHYDEDQDQWFPVYRTNTCDIIQTFIGVVFLNFIILILGLICCFAIGSEIGWLMAMIAEFSFIDPAPVVAVTTVLICAFVGAALIVRFTENKIPKQRSIIPEIVKAKMNKVCAEIDIVD